MKKGVRNELLTQKELEAATRLTACSFPPLYNREAMDFTLGSIGEVTQMVPCSELRFVPDERVVELISDQISAVN